MHDKKREKYAAALIEKENIKRRQCLTRLRKVFAGVLFFIIGRT
jgi:hypothetical protein